MKNDIIETVVSFTRGDDKVEVCTAMKKYANQLLRFKDQYPNEVDIIVQNKDGSIVAKVPVSWFRFVRPKTVRKDKEEEDGD